MPTSPRGGWTRRSARRCRAEGSYSPAFKIRTARPSISMTPSSFMRESSRLERRAVHVQVLRQLLLAEGHDADAVRRGRQAVEADQQAVAQARLGQQVVLTVEIGELRRDLHEQVRHHAHDVRVAAVVNDALRRKKQHARRREGPDLHPAALRAEGHGLAEARAACSGRAR